MERALVAATNNAIALLLGILNLNLTINILNN
jgi:hypothetical protein